MPIDKATINLYTCCKCRYQWTNWDGKERKEGPIPVYCPKCKNIRWNQRYIEEEIALIDRLQDELYKTKLIRKSGEKTERGKVLRLAPRVIYNYDFITHDFLNMIFPQPELFELKQLLAISKNDIEERHEFMLSIIKERLDNADKYEEEHSKHYYDYDKIGFDPSTWDSKKYSPARRRIMNRSTNCKHKRIPEIENKLYPDYDKTNHSRKWVELKEEED